MKWGGRLLFPGVAPSFESRRGSPEMGRKLYPSRWPGPDRPSQLSDQALPAGPRLSLTVHAGGLCPRGASHLAGRTRALYRLGALLHAVPVAAAMRSCHLAGALLHGA